MKIKSEIIIFNEKMCFLAENIRNKMVGLILKQPLPSPPNREDGQGGYRVRGVHL